MSAGGSEVERLRGSQATEILEKVAGNRAVREFSEELGVDPAQTVLENSTVERLPEDLGIGAELFVAVKWVDRSDRTVRTGHFLAANGTLITSKLYRLDNTGPEPVLEHGILGRNVERVTASEAERQKNVGVHASDSYVECLATGFGVSAGFLAVVVAGCGLACWYTAGLGCGVCLAGAFGMSVGEVVGVMTGCAG